MKQDKSLKSTKQTIESNTQLNAVITSKEFCKEQNLQQSFENYTRRNSTPSSHVICTIFELGGMAKHLMTGPTGKREFCFPCGQSFTA